MMHDKRLIQSNYIGRFYYNIKQLVSKMEKEMKTCGRGRYEIGRKLGSGAFGIIRLGTQIHNQQPVAIKLEKMVKRSPSQLYSEVKIYKELQGEKGIPKLHWFGTENEYNIMVLELLGPSIEDILQYCEKKMPIKTLLMLADQMLTRIELFHDREYIHRDIKPENYCIGIGESRNMVFIVDYGLSKKYMITNEDLKREHIPYKDGKKLTGTARYASLNTHLGIEQSRRDDIETFAYVLVYLLRGTLPWQGIAAATKNEKYSKILQNKMAIPFEALLKGFPSEFISLFLYTRSLHFEEKPDYQKCRQFFKELYITYQCDKDSLHEWTILGKKEKRNSKIEFLIQKGNWLISTDKKQKEYGSSPSSSGCLSSNSLLSRTSSNYENIQGEGEGPPKMNLTKLAQSQHKRWREIQGFSYSHKAYKGTDEHTSDEMGEIKHGGQEETKSSIFNYVTPLDSKKKSTFQKLKPGEEGRDKCLIPDERTELEVAKVPMSAIQNEEHYKLHKTPKLKKRIYMHTDTQHKESTQF